MSAAQLTMALEGAPVIGGPLRLPKATEVHEVAFEGGGGNLCLLVFAPVRWGGLPRDNYWPSPIRREFFGSPVALVHRPRCVGIRHYALAEDGHLYLRGPAFTGAWPDMDQCVASILGASAPPYVLTGFGLPVYGEASA